MLKRILIAALAMMAMGQVQAVLMIDASITDSQFSYTLTGNPTNEQLGSSGEDELQFYFENCCVIWDDYISPIDIGSFSVDLMGSFVGLERSDEITTSTNFDETHKWSVNRSYVGPFPDNTDSGDFVIFALNDGDTFKVSPNRASIPEPATLALLGLGLVGLGFVRQRKA